MSGVQWFPFFCKRKVFTPKKTITGRIRTYLLLPTEPFWFKLAQVSLCFATKNVREKASPCGVVRSWIPFFRRKVFTPKNILRWIQRKIISGFRMNPSFSKRGLHPRKHIRVNHEEPWGHEFNESLFRERGLHPRKHLLGWIQNKSRRGHYLFISPTIYLICQH